MHRSQAHPCVPCQVIHPLWVARSTPPARCHPTAPPAALRAALARRWMALARTHRRWAGARPRSTRHSCTSSVPRSWPTSCWHGGNRSQSTSRLLSRESGLCLGCSHRFLLYLHPLVPRRARDKHPEQGQRHLGIPDLMVRRGWVESGGGWDCLSSCVLGYPREAYPVGSVGELVPFCPGICGELIPFYLMLSWEIGELVLG